MRPLELMEELGWLGDDVWFAHGIHLSASEIERLAESGTGVVHCPSSNMRLGAGACPVEELTRAGVPVGLGVDGAASNEDGNLAGEVHQAVLLARLRASLLGRDDAATALDGRQAWSLGWRGGAACLGRDDCGTLEPGKCADLAAFRVDDLSHVGIEDPLQALALAPPARVEAVLVGGRVVVREGRLQTADEDTVTAGLALACRKLREAARA
jgi:cytosine/adenosine deaminase-related metal-dependent hydrolase